MAVEAGRHGVPVDQERVHGHGGHAGDVPQRVQEVALEVRPVLHRHLDDQVPATLGNMLPVGEDARRPGLVALEYLEGSPE